MADDGGIDRYYSRVCAALARATACVEGWKPWLEQLTDEEGKLPDELATVLHRWEVVSARAQRAHEGAVRDAARALIPRGDTLLSVIKDNTDLPVELEEDWLAARSRLAALIEV